MRTALHDLANLLTVINGFAEMGERDIIRGDVLKAIGRLQMVRQVAKDCADIIHDAFASVPAIVPGQFDLNSLAKKIAAQIDDQLEALGIEMRIDAHTDPLLVQGDEMAMQRTIFNLCLNARNSIAHGGVIFVTTRCRGAKAEIEVKDSGSGMSDETLRDLWNAKPSGEHGHGLKIVKQTIEEAHGAIEVSSVVGSGTTFRITLPSVSCASAAA